MRLQTLETLGVEPVLLNEAKNHLRVDIDEDNSLIEGLVTSARRYCETRLKRAIVQQRFELKLPQFPSKELVLPKPPLVSVESISYRTAEGTQTLPVGQYEVITGTPGLVLPSYGQSFPSALCRSGSVTVTYTAGYSGEVPETIKHAIKLLVGHYYSHRAASITIQGARMDAILFGVEALLSSEDFGFYG